MSELLFVYGSLKRGYWNHHYMKDCEFLGDVSTYSDEFAVFNVGFPMVLTAKSIVHQDCELLKRVRGELWKVDSLERFDRLENEGSLYVRKEITVWALGRDVEDAWIYVAHPDYKDIRYKAPLCYVNSDNEYEWRG